jgi:chromosome transmission fidelity protein 1
MSTDLIDTMLSIHSVAISVDQIRTAKTQVEAYYQRFKNRLKPVHAVHLMQCLSIMQGLVSICEEWSLEASNASGSTKRLKTYEELFRVNDITARMKGGADQVNLIELVRYLKESHLAQKVSGYVEKTAVETAHRGMSDSLTIQ